jgi:hypothetical protein
VGAVCGVQVVPPSVVPKIAPWRVTTSQVVAEKHDIAASNSEPRPSCGFQVVPPSVEPKMERVADPSLPIPSQIVVDAQETLTKPDAEVDSFKLHVIDEESAPATGALTMDTPHPIVAVAKVVSAITIF